jgi:hypothetical protein
MESSRHFARQEMVNIGKEERSNDRNAGEGNCGLLYCISEVTSITTR